mmetsp:Transcript_47257/g.55178  ORF Transcript_47257/g.55178 Transcript_47257/m.55178 type:complete len:94 (+) Transcript_47257:2963-3244(+)
MDKLDLQLSSNISQAVNTFVQVKWFRKTSTELQRVASITLSPISSDFSMTISGTPSIRAYSAQTRFFEKCKGYIDPEVMQLWNKLNSDIITLP